MTKHKIGTRKEWLAARLELLHAEKELTRRSDEVARRRQDATSCSGPTTSPAVLPARRSRMTSTVLRTFPWASSFGSDFNFDFSVGFTEAQQREDGVVYHTYPTYARGLDGLLGMYQWLDRAPLGRNENDVWWRRNDEYKS